MRCEKAFALTKKSRRARKSPALFGGDDQWDSLLYTQWFFLGSIAASPNRKVVYPYLNPSSKEGDWQQINPNSSW